MIETPIPSEGELPCERCGEDLTIELSKASGWARCKCGARRQWRQPVPEIASVFALFGVELSIDYDGQLIASSDEQLTESVADWLFKHQGTIRSTIERKGRSAMSQFVGGTMDGKRHCRHPTSWDRQVLLHHGRADWEVYEFRGDDPRLFFVGRTTSKAKAKRGEFVS